MSILSSVTWQISWVENKSQVVDRKGASGVGPFLADIEVYKYWVEKKVVIKNEDSEDYISKTIAIKNVKEVTKLLVLADEFVITKISYSQTYAVSCTKG